MSTQTDRSKICAVTGCGGAMAMHPDHKRMFPTCAKCKGSWTLDEADRGIGADPPQQASKADAGKARLDLIPRDALEALAAALAFGAAKYAPWDWTRGRAWSRDYAAVQRHLSAWFEGEDNDPIDGPNGSKGSGLSHLAHALCGIVFLIVFQKRGIGTDDRFKWPSSAPAAEPEPTAAHDPAVDWIVVNTGNAKLFLRRTAQGCTWTSERDKASGYANAGAAEAAAAFVITAHHIERRGPSEPAAHDPAVDWILVDRDRPHYFYKQTPNGWIWVTDRELATGFPNMRTALTAAPTVTPFLAELRRPAAEPEPAADRILADWIVVNFTGRSFFRVTAESFEWVKDRNQATGFDSSYAAGRALEIRNLSIDHKVERRGPALAPGRPVLG